MVVGGGLLRRDHAAALALGAPAPPAHGRQAGPTAAAAAEAVGPRRGRAHAMRGRLPDAAQRRGGGFGRANRRAGRGLEGKSCSRQAAESGRGGGRGTHHGIPLALRPPRCRAAPRGGSGAAGQGADRPEQYPAGPFGPEDRPAHRHHHIREGGPEERLGGGGRSRPREPSCSLLAVGAAQRAGESPDPPQSGDRDAECA
mmetsp:Transcript_63967/g.162108  ORF Transcript_63967/g.162108 Transcript_63967/m.162108 type:complete len:200 (+) Transcript_63967:276-875(+)